MKPSLDDCDHVERARKLLYEAYVNPVVDRIFQILSEKDLLPPEELPTQKTGE